jgi:hypothetical protein
MSREGSLLAFFGHHKCATSYIHEIVRRVAREVGLHERSVSTPATFEYDLARWVQDNRVDLLVYRLADYQHVKPLGDFKGFHVIRDPRDVVVSAYFSHLYSHPVDGFPVIAGLREQLQKLSKEDGLLLEMESREQQFKCMVEWDYSLPNVLEIKFEDLVRNPYQHFLDIFRFLGLLDEQRYGMKERTVHFFYRGLRALEDRSERRLPIPLFPERLTAERLLGIVWEHDFGRKAGGRRLGQEDVRHHYRKGEPGDWKNHFTEQHIARFKEQYNHILIKLGYEQDANW